MTELDKDVKKRIKRFLEYTWGWSYDKYEKEWSDSVGEPIGGIADLEQFLADELASAKEEGAREGKRKAFEEVVAFRSPYVYDEYSTLYQKSSEIRYKYFDEENKFLNKKIKELSQKDK